MTVAERLIRESDVIKLIDEWLDNYPLPRHVEKGLMSHEELLAYIAEAPTIEAKPVVRAHWEQVITVVKKIHEYEQEDIQYRCDHCGHIVDDFENYCGGCGAQMFEGVKIPVISMEDVPKIMEEMEK